MGRNESVSGRKDHGRPELQGKIRGGGKEAGGAGRCDGDFPGGHAGGAEKADYMRICFAMLESADAAVFLPDWEDSPGAQLEKHWCEYVGKKMVFLMEGAE